MSANEEMQKSDNPNEHRHVHKHTRAIINRLSRTEGHIRSIKTMLEDGRDCAEILIQISAVQSAVNRAGKAILEDHLESCLFHQGFSPDENDIWLSVKDVFDAYF
jgi:DNA-binding FrmR family transcriptional regulator